MGPAALEPAIQPHAVLAIGHRQGADLSHTNALRAMKRPTITATMARTAEPTA
jgi:hypothetical protein